MLLEPQNQFVRGEYAALGKKLTLRDVRCPAYLLAGKDDDFILGAHCNAETALGTPAENWKKIEAWIAAHTKARSGSVVS